jgi:hypothetical protein
MEEFKARGDQAERAHNRQRVVFIETDIDMAMTFVRLATTDLSLGKWEDAMELVARAIQVEETVATLIATVPDEENRQRLHEKWQALAEALQEVQRQENNNNNNEKI